MAKKAKKKAEVKYYELRKGKETHIFTGKTPRQAALKAATRGFKDIKLRERGRRNQDGTYSVHMFKGEVKMVAAPENRPDWLPDKVKKPKVSKVGVERTKKI